MSVQVKATRAGLIESWAQWEGEAINGTFALRRIIGRSDHSLSFLTDYKSQAFADAAIKIVPAAFAPADALLAQWRTAAVLAHPHLIRILDLGRYERAGQPFLFVVMEYADETLAEVLPQRPLTGQEVQGLLPPVLDALAFLHRNGLVHGQLKPSNVLVVSDQIKLASDTVRPSGDSLGGIALPSSYDAPESKEGRLSAAADVWALGVTVIEALTQQPPSWDDAPARIAALPANLPLGLRAIVERCLRANPVERPTVRELQAILSGKPLAPEVSVAAPAPPAHEPPAPQAVAAAAVHRQRDAAAPAAKRHTAPTTQTGVPAAPAKAPAPKVSAPEAPARSLVPYLAAVVVVLVVAWAGTRLLRHSPAPPPPVPVVTESVAPPAPRAAPAVEAAPPAEAAPTSTSGVLHEELPTVSRTARNSIHGHFNVVVRVIVNRSGKVVDGSLQEAGPSHYFAKIASRAARQWKFVPTEERTPRAWLLRFEFSREQTTVKADALTVL